MPDKPFYITTAIDYTNAAPHIGHAYEKVLADVLARYQRLAGREVLFLTGVDQHGQKVQQAAEKRGIAPGEFASDITGLFLSLWEKLGISFDRWAATTDPLHQQTVQKILTRLHEDGLLYKAKHEGYYSVRQEQFLTDKERDEDGNFGEEWGEVVFLEEENWYFRLGDQLNWLERYLDSHPDAVVPDFRWTELRNAVGRSGGDLCISRPKSRLTWGIEIPFDPEFVTYVWFDALINYVSFAGYLSGDSAELSLFDRMWPAEAHVIGKDILVPAHGVYWLCMLHAMGFSDAQMPRLLVHGWWNLGGAKVSKSLGNIVDPLALCDRYGVDALRFYLMRDIAPGRDADFSEERLVSLHNSELANGMGNLLNRTLNMTHRYRDGVLQPLPESPDPRTGALLAEIQQAVENYAERMEDFDVQAGLKEMEQIVDAANGYAEQLAPWKLAKQPEEAQLLDETLTAMALSARAAAVLLTPFAPTSAETILAQLRMTLPDRIEPQAFGTLEGTHEVGTPSPVFPRLEIPTSAD